MKKKPNPLAYYLTAGALLAIAAFGFPIGRVGLGNSSTRRKGVNPDYFSLFYDYDDLTRSETAQTLGVSNSPNLVQVENARRFAQTVLDPIATFIGEAPQINSWFRSSQVNANIPGSSNSSDHLDASAADVTLKDGNNNYLIVRAILTKNLPVDQIILYGGLGGKQYIHLGQDIKRSLDDQRMQILEKVPGGYASVSENVAATYFL